MKKQTKLRKDYANWIENENWEFYCKDYFEDKKIFNS
jgi:hypothetical protein